MGLPLSPSRTAPGLCLAERPFSPPGLASNLPGCSVDLEVTPHCPLFHSSCHIRRLLSPPSRERHWAIPGRERWFMAEAVLVFLQLYFILTAVAAVAAGRERGTTSGS